VTQFRPMLAGKYDPAKQRFPALGSPKLDGVRALIKNRTVLSRSLTPFPNKRLQLQFGREELEGYDGELIVGNPWDKNVCDATRSETAQIDGPCTADFYVFDRHDMPQHNYLYRQAYIYPYARTHLLEQTYLHSLAEVDAYEQQQLDIGYEGIILRKPDGMYKYGRSTVNEGLLLKVKRFEDSEAQIIGMEELMHNANEAQLSNIGLIKRQTLQENQHGMGTMGALLLRDVHTGVEFKIGTGFTAEQRAWFWRKCNPTTIALGYPIIVKYKFFPVGVKDKPRHPVYLGLRDRSDMS
jgi:DNA ligase-1